MEKITAKKRRAVRLMLQAIVVVLLALQCGLTNANTSADTSVELPKTQDAIIFIRHALAPGTGDPADFDVNACSTQRNLSEQGRQQAKAIGRKLRNLGAADIDIYSSEWCRCRDTAELFGLGPVESQPLLNSFFASPSDGAAQLQKLRQWLSEVDGPLVLVTHQVVITGMTNVYPASGEMVVTTLGSDGELSIVTTVATEIR